MVERQILEILCQAARPSYGRIHSFQILSQPKVKILGMLRQEPGTGLHILRLPERAFDDTDGCSDAVAIALVSPQAEGDGVAQMLHGIAQDAQLGSIPVLENNLDPAVAIEIGQSEGAAVVAEIQSGYA